MRTPTRPRSVPPARRRRLPTAALLAAVAVVAATASPAQAAPSPGHAGAAAPPAAASSPGGTAAHPGATVTLVTGDKVTLGPVEDGQPTVRVRPRPGTNPGFHVRRDGASVSVIPDDVASLVPDVLDPRLFDVTALASMGYDDAHRATLPLIVQRAPGVRTLAAAPDGLHPQRALGSIDATAATLDKDDAAGFGDRLAEAQDRRGSGPRGVAATLGGIDRVWLDAKLSESDLDQYLTQVSAPAAWDSGLDGSGVTVAVLDTGVDEGHPDLAGQVVGESNFTDSPTADDVEGHGTHVASLVAGTGAEADGARRGIAYGAQVLSGKVLGDDGFGQASWVIAGMQWAVAQGADIVNMSLGAQAGPADDPVVQALDELTASSGALFVVAAGNGGGFGDYLFKIESPGIAASALTVGAVAANDSLALFSSKGPTLGSYRLKPDVSAPGVDILGARAGARDGDFYVPMRGTSQATPLVAGAAALLEQQHPDWTWQQVKAAIVDTAYRSEAYDNPWGYGGGRLDLAQATTQTLVSSQANVDFAYVKFPDEDERSQTVTLTNAGADAVTVQLTDGETSHDGQAAPDDAVTVSPSTLTVPAGGSASTTVTLDPAAVPDGLYSGTLTVTSGDTPRLRLPVGFYDEPPMYDVHLRVLDRRGEPYAGGRFWYVDGDSGNGRFGVPLDADGETTLRLPPGHYAFFATVTTPAGDGRPETTSVVGTAELAVDHELSYVMDARDAVRVRPPTVAGQRTDVGSFAFGVSRMTDYKKGQIDFPAVDLDTVKQGRLFVTPTEQVERGTFLAGMHWRLDAVGHLPHGAPQVYEVLRKGDRVSSDMWPRLEHRDVARMARLDETFHAAADPGQYVVTRGFGLGFFVSYARPIQVPAHLVERVTASPDVEWGRCVYLPDPPIAVLCDRPRSYRPGERVHTDLGTGLRPAVADATYDATDLYFTMGIGDADRSGPFFFGVAEDQSLTLYRNGELVGTAADSFGYFHFPEGPADFRLQQTYTLRPDALAFARQARSTWTFHFTPVADPPPNATAPPMLEIGYDPHVDAYGRAKPRQPLWIGLDVRHIHGAAPPPGGVHRPHLAYSVDGGRGWTEAQVVRDGGDGWRALVPGNVLRPGGSVSVRARASDAAGGTIRQTVLDMIPVR